MSPVVQPPSLHAVNSTSSTAPLATTVAPPVGAGENYDSGDIRTRLILTYDGSYLKSRKAVVYVLYVLFSVMALTCVVSSGDSGWNSYLLIPFASHLRFFVFTVIFGLVTTIIILLIHTFRADQVLAVDWRLVELCLFTTLAAFYLVAVSLVSVTISVCLRAPGVSTWAVQQLVMSVVLACVCMLLCASSIFLSRKATRLFTVRFCRRTGGCTRNSSERSLRSSTASSVVI